MAVGYTAKGDSPKREKAVPDRRGTAFAVGKPRVWTEARIQSSVLGVNYDIAPDGKRLAALLADDSEKLPTHLTFLLNFFDELRRKAPLGQ